MNVLSEQTNSNCSTLLKDFYVTHKIIRAIKQKDPIRTK